MFIDVAKKNCSSLERFYYGEPGSALPNPDSLVSSVGEQLHWGLILSFLSLSKNSDEASGKFHFYCIQAFLHLVPSRKFCTSCIHPEVWGLKGQSTMYSVMGNNRDIPSELFKINTRRNAMKFSR